MHCWLPVLPYAAACEAIATFALPFYVLLFLGCLIDFPAPRLPSSPLLPRSVEEFMQAKNITEADVRAAGGPAPPPAPGAEATGRSTLKSARRRAEEAAMNATATGGEGGVGVTAITYPNWAVREESLGEEG